MIDLETIAYRDSLLGLPNMAALSRDEELYFSDKLKGSAVKFYLEDFKQFNDTFGHEYGDIMLRNISTYLRELSPEGTLYRVGGVEFVLMMPGASYSESEELADDACERCTMPWDNNGINCVCTISAGMVRFPDTAKDMNELLNYLTFAVDEAASSGGNRVVVFDTTLSQKIYRRNSIARCLQESLASGTLDVHYRPTYHMDTKRFVRAETYLAMPTSEFGYVYQNEFLPIAEAVGLVCQVNIYVIRKVCRLIAEFIQKDIQFESIDVLVSPILLLQETFIEELSDIISKNSIPPKKLALEITESALITTNNNINIAMQELNALGVELILGNFGTGYSGITSITDLPVSTVKLDRLFVWQLEVSNGSSVLLEGLTDIAHKLELKVIAEGVETQNQIDKITSFGCDYQQGFYYSATVAKDKLEGILGKSV